MAALATTQSPAHTFPGEIVVLIAKELDVTSLCRAQQTCKTWQTLIKDADAQLWADHARHLLSPDFGPEATGSLEIVLAKQRSRCFDTEHWDGVRTWQDLCRQLTLLEGKWDNGLSDARCEVFGGFEELPAQPTQDPNQPARPHLLAKGGTDLVDVILARERMWDVWRARLDTDRDAKFVIITTKEAGLKVVDARPGASLGRVLFAREDVTPYAHLEYQDGIACWNAGNSIEVWKRCKLVHGTETEEQRGHFERVGTLPSIPGMRGFMLNKQQQLAVISEEGTLAIWNIGVSEPSLLKQLPVEEGATGHIEHNEDLVVYSMGESGYSFYRKQSGEKIGSLDFRREIGDAYEYDSTPEVYLHFGSRMSDAKTQIPVDPASSCDRAPHKCATTKLCTGRLDDKVFQSALDRDVVPSNTSTLTTDEWGAAMLRPLRDSSTLFIARSKSQRIFVCTDILGLLEAIGSGIQLDINAKAHRCSCIIESGSTTSRDDFHEGGWLAVNNGRAAFQIEDQVYIVPLPQAKDTSLCPGTVCTQITSQYEGALPSPRHALPISFMSLHDDALLTTYVHPMLVFVDDITAETAELPWEAEYTKSVRIVRFAPNASSRSRPQLRDVVVPPGCSQAEHISALESQTQIYVRDFKSAVRSQFMDQPYYVERVALQRLRRAQRQIAAFLEDREQGVHQSEAENDIINALRTLLADEDVAEQVEEAGGIQMELPPPDGPLRIEDFADLVGLDFDSSYSDRDDGDLDNEFDLDYMDDPTEMGDALEDFMPAYDSEGERIYNPVLARLARARDNMLVEAALGDAFDEDYDDIDHDFDDVF